MSSDITGQRFNRLVAQRPIGAGRWLCKCDCGRECYPLASELRAHRKRTCGPKCGLKQEAHRG